MSKINRFEQLKLKSFNFWELIDSIGNKVEWNYQTYASYLNVLCEKGFVGFKKRGRTKFYYPLVEKDDCIEAESKSILHKLSHESAEKLLLCMIRDTQLSESGQEKLKALIEELNGKE